MKYFFSFFLFVFSTNILSADSAQSSQDPKRPLFQCDVYALDPNPEWSNVFRYKIQKWNYGKAECVTEGNPRTLKLPKVTHGTSDCSADYILKEISDGCSAGGSADKRRFKAACNEHDACYGTLGKSKSTCDKNFKANMEKICSKYLPTCFINSTAFYDAVVLAGKSGYDWDQKWAKKHCSNSLYNVWKKINDIPPMNPEEQKMDGECFVIKVGQPVTTDMIIVLKSVTKIEAEKYVDKHCTNNQKI